jgi:hypothetical protein
MGGIDELGLIPENCIFLQVPKPSYNKAVAGHRRDEYMVVKGTVMVTKHPVMHPGEPHRPRLSILDADQVPIYNFVDGTTYHLHQYLIQVICAC